ncbi:phage protein Gp37 [Sphingomonas gilva]|uniref:phage protein Gp37 n=1 Tax=Sphingomonas gilva TaxID=2305907 RepID=UPI0015F98679|nr:phage protein Gp37 [Sphingomonas gilva]
MISAVELAMLARLKAAADADRLGYAWKTLDTYPEDWGAYLANDPWRAPAAWASFDGFRGARRDDRGGLMAQCSFGLVVASQSKRNQASARHGHGDAEPGSYQLMLDAVGLLDGSDLGLEELGELTFAGAAAVALDESLRKRGASLIGIRFDCELPIAALTIEDGREIAPFEVFHANWDIAPFGGVDADREAPGVQLPADDAADATDHVELPQ